MRCKFPLCKIGGHFVASNETFQYLQGLLKSPRFSLTSPSCLLKEKSCLPVLSSVVSPDTDFKFINTDMTFRNHNCHWKICLHLKIKTILLTEISWQYSSIYNNNKVLFYFSNKPPPPNPLMLLWYFVNNF